MDRALELKADRLASRALEGRSVALVFERPSTRTRVSFEVGVAELGGHPLVLREGELQLTRGESARDTALVLSRYVHAIGVRTGPHELVEELAAHSTIPVVNMLTREHHPCQALADLVTLRERFGTLEGLRLAYVGDGNNVARSLLILGAPAGVEVAVASPAELSLRRPGHARARRPPRADAHARLHRRLGEHGRRGRAPSSDGRARALPPRRGAARAARDDAVALHCLPAHPGEEISEGVLYGERSAVWDQAENRLHAQKALLELLCPEGRARVDGCHNTR